MSYVHPAYVQHQLKRWQRHDEHRFLKPEAPARKSYAERLIDQRCIEEKQAVVAEAEVLCEELEQLRWLTKSLKVDLAIQRLRFKYSPDQPRDELGRWTDSGQGTSSNVDGEPAVTTDDDQDEEAVAEEGVILVANGPRGHHYVNQGLYRDLPLPAETRKVFHEATTGPLPPMFIGGAENTLNTTRQ